MYFSSVPLLTQTSVLTNGPLTIPQYNHNIQQNKEGLNEKDRFLQFLESRYGPCPKPAIRPTRTVANSEEISLGDEEEPTTTSKTETETRAEEILLETSEIVAAEPSLPPTKRPKLNLPPPKH